MEKEGCVLCGRRRAGELTVLGKRVCRPCECRLMDGRLPTRHRRRLCRLFG